MNIALIIAGGSGTRMHQNIPKQFLTVNDRPVIVYTLEAFQRHPEIDAIAVVCIEGWEHVLKAYAAQYGIGKLRWVIPGGENGQASIRNGVFELERSCAAEDLVLVHDAIRPLVSAEIISDCILTARRYGSAVATIPCAEAMLETTDGETAMASYPRSQLRRTQTPQGFPLGRLCAYHRRALEKGITDSIASCTLAIELGEEIHFSAGSEKNIKLTTVEDIDIFKALLSADKPDWQRD